MEWPCANCRLRDLGICGALIGEQSRESRPLAHASWQDFKKVSANDLIVKRGDESKFVHVVCEGWASRFFLAPEGQIQILNFLLPGDLFSAVSLFDDWLDYSVRALTEVRFARFNRAEFRVRLGANPAILTELGKSCLVEHKRADEMLTVLGRRSAEERIAYLFLHLTRRIRTTDATREQPYPFPLRQQHIADILGLTPVHVNRVMGTLRDRGLVELSGGFLRILNRAELDRLGSLT